MDKNVELAQKVIDIKTPWLWLLTKDSPITIIHEEELFNLLENIRMKLRENLLFCYTVERKLTETGDTIINKILTVELAKLIQADDQLLHNIKKFIEVFDAVPEEISKRVEDNYLERTNAKTKNVSINSTVQSKTNNGNLVGVEINELSSEKIYINTYVGNLPDNRDESLSTYCRNLIQSVASYPMQGLDIQSSDPTHIPEKIRLIQIYVDLDVKNISNLAEELSIAIDNKPAIETISNNKKLVLLGDPGSGKTTLINYLTLCLGVKYWEGGAKLINQISLPSNLNRLIPIKIILRDFAWDLPETLTEPSPDLLWKFFTKQLERQNLSFAINHLHDELENGKVLISFDGLDEVQSINKRAFIRDVVESFVKRYPDNYYLVTCRTFSYQPPSQSEEPDLRLKNWTTAEICSFNLEKVNQFILGWHNELERINDFSESHIEKLQYSLLQAVQRPDLWPLAINPLLLTVMALVHTHRGHLPETRALLYEETIDILLWRWEQIKTKGDGGDYLLKKLLNDANREVVDLKRTLWEVAYSVHSENTNLSQSDKLADITQYNLIKAFAKLHPNKSQDWALEIIKIIKLRAGLLIERAPEIFSFPHRTFQEYLAGSFIASQNDFAKSSSLLIDLTDYWRQTILLAVGKLVYSTGDIEKPISLIWELCPSVFDKNNHTMWRKASIAGDILLEIGLSRVEDIVLGQEILPKVKNRLLESFSSDITLNEKSSNGKILSRLGDTRFNKDIQFLPNDQTLGFKYIPGGVVQFGSNEQIDKNSLKYERPLQELKVNHFYISKWTVTIIQFYQYQKDSGLNMLAPDPTDWNKPITQVSWFDANNYCEWLYKKLINSDNCPSKIKDLLLQGWIISLPSEKEWEKAAKGHNYKVYPWGKKFDSKIANTKEAGIHEIISVGCSPKSQSDHHVEDMIANVWEWTRSIWVEQAFPYESYSTEVYTSHSYKGREKQFVIKGGSFASNYTDARIATRSRFLSEDKSKNLGFRMVLIKSV